jgi:hypothetical protein
LERRRVSLERLIVVPQFLVFPLDCLQDVPLFGLHGVSDLYQRGHGGHAFSNFMVAWEAIAPSTGTAMAAQRGCRVQTRDSNWIEAREHASWNSQSSYSGGM